MKNQRSIRIPRTWLSKRGHDEICDQAYYVTDNSLAQASILNSRIRDLSLKPVINVKSFIKLRSHVRALEHDIYTSNISHSDVARLTTLTSDIINQYNFRECFNENN